MEQPVIVFPTLTARHIMTPRADWLAFEPGMQREDIIRAAQHNHYDLIPVRDAEQRVSGFLLAPDYREIPLQLDWCCTHDTPLETLLDYFVRSGHSGCFLLCESEVIGLVTPADFNKAIARSAIYIRLAELEILLVQYLSRQGFTTPEKILPSLSEKRREELNDLLAERRAKNSDVNLVELLNLSDLLNVIKKHKCLYRLLEYESGRQFGKAVSGLVDLRHCVAHPVRKIHRSIQITDLHTRLKKAEDLTRRLRAVLNDNHAKLSS
jgi:hypothetical protein